MNKVLIIEDSQSFNKLLVHTIESSSDFECVPAHSLAEAEAILSSRAEEFFSAVIDISLPDAPDGEAVDLVIQHSNIAPVVFTGQLSASLREDFVHKRIADYVLKDGQHNLNYIVGLLQRLYNNAEVKVLVVDDSLTARNQLKRLLITQRFRVYLASSGKEALEIIDENPDIRIALLDCFMEEMDGFQLCSHIRKNYGKDQLVIIGVSSQGGHAISARFIKSGANDFLLKPFQPEEFNCRLNQNAEFMEQFQTLKQVNEQKNELLGMAAHDIRGPLSIINNAAEMLLKKDLNADRQNSLLDMIGRSSKNMLGLLNDLLDVSALESGQVAMKQEENDLALLVKQQLEFHQIAAEKKSIRLVENLPSEARAMIDANRIRQVLDNLINNAIKYSPLSSHINVDLSDLGESWQIAISDQGPGIPEEDRPRLFGSFQRLNSQTTAGEGSSGLGLSICKSMVDAHGGEIGYRDNDSVGSCFYVNLPKTVQSA
jgi:CheY-like chemotaxis protein